MGIGTIAELVGDETPQRLLGEYGVDLAQGHHSGRPADVAGLWLASAGIERRPR